MPTNLERIEEKHRVKRLQEPPDDSWCALCNEPGPCDVVKLARALDDMLKLIRECEGSMLVAAIHGETCSPEQSEAADRRKQEAERALAEVAGEGKS